MERTFHGCESSMERKFLEHSLLRSESSRGAIVPWNESYCTFCSPGANVPRNVSSTGAKVLSVDFLLPGTKVQRNEKARYQLSDHCSSAHCSSNSDTHQLLCMQCLICPRFDTDRCRLQLNNNVHVVCVILIVCVEAVINSIRIVCVNPGLFVPLHFRSRQ